MTEGVVLLVEDDPKDEALGLRALDKSPVRPQVVVVRDGAEALDSQNLFGSPTCRVPFSSLASIGCD